MERVFAQSKSLFRKIYIKVKKLQQLKYLHLLTTFEQQLHCLFICNLTCVFFLCLLSAFCYYVSIKNLTRIALWNEVENVFLSSTLLHFSMCDYEECVYFSWHISYTVYTYLFNNCYSIYLFPKVRGLDNLFLHLPLRPLRFEYVQIWNKYIFWKYIHFNFYFLKCISNGRNISTITKTKAKLRE